MERKTPNIFECMDWLDKHQEGDSQYQYYAERLENCKKIGNTLGNPFFEEIKGKTKGIQKILADSGYKDLDGLLKALIIDGIKFFLNLDYQIQVDDDIHFDDYYLGLFCYLGINTTNTKLLNEILSELEKGGEKLPKSPIDFLVNYDYNKKNEQNELGKNPSKLKEEIITPKDDELNRIIQDFWGKDYGFIKDLRMIGVKDDRLEYTFLVGLYRDIVKLVKGEAVDERAIDKIFKYYSIDISDEQLLLSLKNKIEKRFPELHSSTSDKKGKVIKPQHGAFDDGSGSEKYCPLVMYEIGDNYIPKDNSCVGEIGKIDPNKNPNASFNMLGAYRNGDRFTVVEPTYSEYIKYDREKIKCWFVNVRSQKTGKIYRALSE